MLHGFADALTVVNEAVLHARFYCGKITCGSIKNDHCAKVGVMWYPIAERVGGG